MTYLQLVNNVLIRLREEQVDAVGQTTYSALVGKFVNDAKRIVESAWEWTALRDTLTIPTVVGQKDYALTGTTNEVRIMEALNTTSKLWIRQVPRQTIVRNYGLHDIVDGAPDSYTVYSINSAGNTVVRVWPRPDAVYSMEFNVLKHQDDLSSDADRLLVPHRPVEALAFALMVAERGESGGLSAQELMQYADSLLSDAIALDANSNPEDLTFQVV